MREIYEQARDLTDVTGLQGRVRQLETEVQTLTQAVEILARGLERGPLAEPDPPRSGEAARQARELLLLIRPERREA